jgi:hypothetical protein
MSNDAPNMWSEEMDSGDRVRAVAEMLTQPRSASWVAEQAQVDYRTARKYLDKLVSDSRLRTVERDRTTCYHPDPHRQFFDELGSLVESHTKTELTEELTRLSERIEGWENEYGVESANELRTTLDESLTVEQRRERAQVADSWEYTREMQMFVRHAIRLYDDLRQFTTDHAPQDRADSRTG